MLNMTLTCNLRTKIMSYDYYWKLELHYVSA